MSKHLHLIKQALNDTVIMDYIPKSPAQYIKLKRSKNTVTRGAVMLTTEQAQKVINAFKGHYLYELVVVAFYYGLRRSEVLGLRWSAVDFENNTLSINHTVVKSLTIEAKDSTKTEGSNATYDLLPNVKEVLLRLRERKPPTSDYIFSHDDGTVLRPDSVTKAFSRVLKNNTTLSICVFTIYGTAQQAFCLIWECRLKMSNSGFVTPILKRLQTFICTTPAPAKR